MRRHAFRDRRRRKYLFGSVFGGYLRYPEFAFTPVIRGNKLWAMENDAPVVLSEEIGTDRSFATDDTNGYLFYFTYSGNVLNAIWYHGLADYAGFISFLRCVLALYAEKTGFVLTDEERKILQGQIRQSVPERLPATDPYGAFGDVSCVPEYSYVNKTGAFGIPADYDYSLPYEHGYTVSLPLTPFLQKTRELGVSFVPLLADVLSVSLGAVYEIGEKPVVMMVPADFRQLAGIDTAVNFSDGMLLPVEPADRSLPVEVRCARMKGALTAQRTLANFKRIAGNKAAAVASFENEQTALPETARSKQQPPVPGSFRAVSSAMSYPGKITFTSGIDRMLADADLFTWIKGTYTLTHTFGDRIRIRVYCRSDRGLWPEKIAETLSSFGFAATLEDRGRVRAPKIDPGAFACVN